MYETDRQTDGQIESRKKIKIPVQNNKQQKVILNENKITFLNFYLKTI